MNAVRTRRFGRPRCLVATVAVATLATALAWTGAVPGAQATSGLDAAVGADAEVRAAAERLEAAREQVEALADELDGAAARYEHARAHRLRLEAEADEVAAAAARAERAAADADAVFEQGVASVYKRPGGSLMAAPALLDSPSARDALHRTALLAQLVASEHRAAQRLAAHAERAASGQAQLRTVQAGVRTAEDAAADAAADLEAATEAARADAEAHAEEVAVAEGDARERLAAERAARQRRERLAADRAAQVDGSGPLPADAALAGMACPVAEPNAFIDSWHFPRSGGRRHLGVDIFADHGLPVYAVADGTVRRVWDNRLGGLSIDLVDERGDRYYYAHLSAAHVRDGERVRAGAHLGDNGNSGNARATPPHLHWQYHPGDGEPVNPYPLAAMLCR